MKKPKAPRLVTVAIFTTITIIFWIFFSLYGVFTSKTPVQVDPKLLEPLVPTLDTNALSRLEGKIFIEEGDVSQPLVVTQPVNLPEAEETPTPEEEITTEVPADTTEAVATPTETP